MDASERIERLGAELERLPDPQARRIAEDLMAAVLELHGEGLARLVERLDEDTLAGLVEDGAVAGLLMVHDLHPVPLDERVLAGLDEVRPYMASHGGDVELLGIEQGVALLRLKGSCDGCAASASTLELAVERALEETAPDLLGLRVEGAEELPGVTGTALPMAGSPAPSLSEWTELDGLEELAPGELSGAEVNGEALVLANVDGSLLAYRDACAECGSSFHGGVLAEGVLACPSCGRRYYLPRAGRSLDDERLQLDPVPLLSRPGEGARVAVPA